MFRNLPIANKTISNRLGRALREKDIEGYGKKQCKELGWMSEKFMSPEKRAVPDQLVTAVDSETSTTMMFFIEYKKPFEKATKLQQKDHMKRRRMGVMVFVVDSYQQFNAVAHIVHNMMRVGKTFLASKHIPMELLT